MSLLTKVLKMFTPAQPATATAGRGATRPMRVAAGATKPKRTHAAGAGGGVAVAQQTKKSPADPTAPSRPVEVQPPASKQPTSKRPGPGTGGKTANGTGVKRPADMPQGTPIHSQQRPAPATQPTQANTPVAPAKPDPRIGEVVELIHKLRDHVDHQNDRFEKAMGVLDQIRGSAAALPEIRQRIDGMLASMDELRQSVHAGQEHMERALAAHGERLDAIAQAVDQASAREERLSKSLAEIGETIRAVSSTNDRLATAIETMRRHEADRDARLGRAITGAQRWLMALTVVMGLGMLAMTVTSIVLATN